MPILTDMKRDEEFVFFNFQSEFSVQYEHVSERRNCKNTNSECKRSTDVG